MRTNGINSFVNQLYPGVTCVNCTVTTSGGSLVAVTANNTTGNINFALAIGGRISGTITNANGGAPLQNIQAQVFGAGGVGMGNTNTNASGVFTSFAVPAGTYYVRTNNTLGFVNELWDNIPCPGSGGRMSCSSSAGMDIVPCAEPSGTSMEGPASASVSNALNTLSQRPQRTKPWPTRRSVSG